MTNRNLIIYIHGKGGNTGEADHYKQLFPGDEVMGFDYRSQTPWEAEKEFTQFVDPYLAEYASVILIANSIGAFFCLSSLSTRPIAHAFFISPIVDMEKLLCNMLLWANVSESELAERKEVKTDYGETLSWKYLCYVRTHATTWNIPTDILYGEKDDLTSLQTVSEFARKTGASLTVMPNGEHWFHTDAQMQFLDAWIRQSLAFLPVC